MYINERVLIYCMAEIDYDMIKFNDVCLFKQLIYELFAKKKKPLTGSDHAFQYNISENLVLADIYRVYYYYHTYLEFYYQSRLQASVLSKRASHRRCVASVNKRTSQRWCIASASTLGVRGRQVRTLGKVTDRVPSLSRVQSRRDRLHIFDRFNKGPKEKSVTCIALHFALLHTSFIN